MIEENFKTASGNTWLAGGVVDVAMIRKFFEKKGVGIEELNETGRFLHIIGISSNKKVFIKISTSDGLNEKLLNEISWHEEISKVKNLPFKIPKLLEHGYIEDTLVYVIYEYVEGVLLDSIVDDMDSTILEKLARTNIAIDSIKNISLFKNQQEREKLGKDITSISEKASEYFKIAQNFANESGESLEELLNVVSNYEKMKDVGLNNNDFTPRNIILSKDNIYLTDGESASATSPRYYDVAIMYARLYVTYCKPDIAKEYLSIFRSFLNRKDLEYFDFAFRTMLASRAIGGFWETTVGGADLEYCRMLEKEISN